MVLYSIDCKLIKVSNTCPNETELLREDRGLEVAEEQTETC